MTHRMARSLAALLCGAALIATPCAADPFDLIYADRIDLTLCDGCGVTLAGLDFGLVVNTGAAPISGATFFGTTFSVSSSQSDLTLHPFINNPGLPVAPILPGEAVGSVPPGQTLLQSLVLPGETFRNTYALQVIAFGVDRAVGSTYQGPVHFDVTMQMGGHVAVFPIDFDLTLGPHAIAFTHAARVSGDSPTAIERPTWGRLKQRYR